MFFWLDPKEPKSQARRKIQHRRAHALIELSYYCDFNCCALMPDSKFLNYCYFTLGCTSR